MYILQCAPRFTFTKIHLGEHQLVCLLVSCKLHFQKSQRIILYICQDITLCLVVSLSNLTVCTTAALMTFPALSISSVAFCTKYAYNYMTISTCKNDTVFSLYW